MSSQQSDQSEDVGWHFFLEDFCQKENWFKNFENENKTFLIWFFFLAYTEHIDSILILFRKKCRDRIEA